MIQSTLTSLIAFIVPFIFLAGFLWLIIPSMDQFDIRRLLVNAVTGAVKEVQQTYVANIKSARPNGKLTTAEQSRAKSAAMAKVHETLGPKGIKGIRKVYGLKKRAVDDFLSTKIEEAVHNLKDRPYSLSDLIVS